MKLYVIEYNDYENDRWEVVVAETEAGAIQELYKTLQNNWGLESLSKVDIKDVEAYPIEEAYGYKVNLVK